MSWFLVLWVGYSCPGGMLSGLVPVTARPYVCAREPRSEILTRRSDAERKVRDVGPGARLLSCRGLRCSEVRVTWSQVAEIEDE